MKCKIILSLLLLLTVCSRAGTLSTRNDNAPGKIPSIKITAPRQGDQFKYLESFWVKVDASDTNEKIEFVEVFLEGYSMGVDSVAPYEIEVSAFHPGADTKIVAIVTNGIGQQQKDSTTVDIVENQKPTVKITHPTQQSIFYANDTVTIEAQASDTDGQVTKVEFYKEHELIGTDQTAPYSVKWVAAEGATTLRATAYDNNAEAAHDYVVAIASKKDFDIRIANPVNGSKLETGKLIVVEAYVSPVSQQIQRMEFFVNDQFIGSDSVAPYSVNWISETGVSMIKAIGVTSAKKVADSVTVQVNDPAKNQSPVVRLMDYYNGSTYTTGATATINASATDADGTIARVEFFVNGVSIGTDTVAPYTWYWSTRNGLFEITAVATDNKGAKSKASDPLKLYVGKEAFIKIISLENGGIYKEGTLLNIEAYAKGRKVSPINERSPVTFYVNDVLQREVKQYPYKIEWLAKKGKAVIRAVTKNSIDTYSDTVTILVNENGGNHLPQVSIIQPENRIYYPGDSISAEASARDEDGKISFVSFYLNGTLINVDSAAPYRAEWIGSEGLAKLKVITKDNEGAETSDSTTVKVITNTPPVIKITNPKNGEVILYGKTLYIAAAVTDTVGKVKQVEFFVNGQTIGKVTKWPYEIYWPIVNGHITIKAIATDEQGLAAADSITAEVNVNQNLVEVKLTSPLSSVMYTTGKTINLDATISNATTTIDFMEFYVNDTLLIRDSVAPYHTTLIRNSAGFVKVSARAIHVDGPGNWTVVAGDATTIYVKRSDFDIKLLPVVSSTGGDIYAETYVNISAIAEDSNDSITSVEFFAEGVSIAVVTKPPYSTQWFTRGGTVVIRAVATNSLGKTVEDFQLVEVLGAYLEFDIKKPVNGQVFTEGDTVNIEALLKTEHFMEIPACFVEFFVNDVSIGSASDASFNSVYKAKWKAEKGYAIIKLVGSTYYGYGYTTSSVVIKVNDTIVNELPKVSILKPVDGGTYKPNENLSIEAEAFDTDGYVKSVSFYTDNLKGNILLIATDTVAPYACEWIPVTEGSYVISAVARDNLGALGYSRDIGIVVSSTSEVKSIDADKWISLYPNPAKDELNISVTENATVQLFGLDGKRILFQKEVIAKQWNALDLQGIANGSYIVKVYTNQFVSFKKVIVNR